MNKGNPYPCYRCECYVHGAGCIKCSILVLPDVKCKKYKKWKEREESERGKHGVFGKES